MQRQGLLQNKKANSAQDTEQKQAEINKTCPAAIQIKMVN